MTRRGFFARIAAASIAGVVVVETKPLFTPETGIPLRIIREWNYGDEFDWILYERYVKPALQAMEGRTEFDLQEHFRRHPVINRA